MNSAVIRRGTEQAVCYISIPQAWKTRRKINQGLGKELKVCLLSQSPRLGGDRGRLPGTGAGGTLSQQSSDRAVAEGTRFASSSTLCCSCSGWEGSTVLGSRGFLRIYSSDCCQQPVLGRCLWPTAVMGLCNPFAGLPEAVFAIHSYPRK